MAEESKRMKKLVLFSERLFEEVINEEGKPVLDENNRRIRKRVPDSAIYISQLIDEEGNTTSYIAELRIMGRRFSTFLDKRDENVEKIKRALEKADERTILKIKELLGVEDAGN